MVYCLLTLQQENTYAKNSGRPVLLLCFAMSCSGKVCMVPVNATLWRARAYSEVGVVKLNVAGVQHSSIYCVLNVFHVNNHKRKPITSENWSQVKTDDWASVYKYFKNVLGLSHLTLRGHLSDVHRCMFGSPLNIQWMFLEQSETHYGRLHCPTWDCH